MSRGIEWRRVGVTTLRMAIGLTGWLLQRSGTALLAWAEGLRPK